MELGKKSVALALVAAGALELAMGCASSGDSQPPGPATTSARASATASATGHACVANGTWESIATQEDAHGIESIAETLGVSIDAVRAGFIGPAVCSPAITYEEVYTGIRISTMTADSATLGPCTPALLATGDGQPPRAGESWTDIEGMACAMPPAGA